LADRVSIILNDALLGELCGVNDQNLKVLEDLFGVGIFSRGNEIFLETEDDEVRHNFKEMISRLEDHVRLGEHPNPDLVRALYESLGDDGQPDRANLMSRMRLVIQKSRKKVFPRSQNQALYIEAIGEKEMVFGIGPAGTGKTYLAIAFALRELLSRTKQRLILTRPVVEAGESLGYLPGDLEQKISPYLRPLYDAMEEILPYEAIKGLEESRRIEVVPLAYMRGRTLANAMIILDEAQNTTKEQIKMFLTRVGEGSKTIITGDITQIDLPRKKNSGLLHVIPLLGSIEEISFVFFNDHDVVRNRLVRKIVNAYEAQKEEE
jgi:phosphate starvation-inducible PhoH-like protein